MRRGAWRALALGLALLAGCSSLQKEGQALIEQGSYQEGLGKLEQALRERPGDTQLRIQYFRSRDQVIHRLLGLAGAELAAGQLEAAGALYRQVLGIDANHARAGAGLAAIEAARRHQLLAEDARAQLGRGDSVSAELMVKAILTENPNHPQAREIERELRNRERQQALAVPALKSRLQHPVNLEFRDAPLKLVMEALSRSAGINFILDREVRPDLKATIFVKNVRVEDAIELIIQNNQLEKKVLTENTILIYPNTPQKLREHQELVMRAFRIGNADPKQTINLLRTMLKTKDLFIDERVNLLVMRDTPDAIRLAEKLIAAQDMADPEVVLELEILEVSRTKVRDLGITTPTELSGPSGTLADIKQLESRSIAADTGYKLKLLRTDGETKTLANPRVRVRNKEKARVHIGDRVPVISSTIVGTTAAGAGGNAPVTTEQIQYLDVGIKIEAEPLIHPDDTIAVKINLDVSSLGTQTKTNAGTTAYEVGTRNATTVLRLKDGETQALMGLIRDDDVQTGSGLPFIGELPLLDRIFGTKKTDRRSRELILLITPQLVRGMRAPDALLAEFWSGTEAALRLRNPFIHTLPDKNPLASAATGTTATPASPANGAAGTAVAGVAATPTVSVPLSDAPLFPLMLGWSAPAKAKIGYEVSVALKAKSEGPLRGATVQLRYEPSEFELIAVDDGGFFSQHGGQTVFTPRIERSLGLVFATLGVADDAPGAKGEGNLITLRLRPITAAPKAKVYLSSVIGLDESSRRVPLQGSTPLELVLEP